MPKENRYSYVGGKGSLVKEAVQIMLQVRDEKGSEFLGVILKGSIDLAREIASDLSEELKKEGIELEYDGFSPGREIAHLEFYEDQIKRSNGKCYALYVNGGEVPFDERRGYVIDLDECTERD